MTHPYESAAGEPGKKQLVPAVVEEYTIPSEAEHKKLIRMLWIACIMSGLGVLVVFGGIVGTLFLKGYDTKKIVEISTAVFQILSASSVVAFFIPLGLTSIVTLLLGIRMNRKSVAVLDKLDSAVEGRLNRIDALFAKFEGFIAGAEKGELPPGIQHYIDDGKAFVKKELEALRNDIRGARAGAEEEMGQALAEGELEAERIRHGQQDLEAMTRCGVCGGPVHGGSDPCPQCPECRKATGRRCGMLHQSL